MEKVYLVFIQISDHKEFRIKIYHGLEQVFDYFGIDGWEDGDDFSLFDNFESDYYFMKKLTRGELKEKMVYVTCLEDCFYHHPDPTLCEEILDNYQYFKIPELKKY